jgi:hypothetical protein
MSLCKGCSRPLRWWNRSVWQDRDRRFHRACWQGKQFFSKFIVSQYEPEEAPEPAPGGYEVDSYDLASQGLIAIWEFGWVSLTGGTLRAASGQFGYRAVPRSYSFGDVTVALTQRV